MTYPVGVTTKTISVGTTRTAFGDTAKVAVRVRPIFGDNKARIVWDATDEVFASVPRVFAGVGGLSFTVPVVDQAGWVDGNLGGAFSMWHYEALVRVSYHGERVEYVQKFQPLTADPSTIDLDTQPDGFTPESAILQTVEELVSSLVPDASTTVKGLVELATSSEATTGTDTVRAVTPAGVKAVIDALKAGVGSAYDTLLEIAAQLATDESAVSALTTTVGGKLAKASNLSDVVSASAARTNLGLGSAATSASSDFSPNLIPAYAGARTKRFDPATSWYNLTPTSLLKLRAKMMLANTQRTKIGFMGHSMLAGDHAAIGTVDPAVHLRKILAGRGVPIGGTGLVYFVTNATQDLRYSAVTGMTKQPGNGPYADGSASGTVTFTSDVAGTIVDVATFDNGTDITVTIDGVSKSVPAHGGVSTPVLRTFTGLANTAHTVVVGVPSGGFFVGVNVRGSTGVEIHNGGMGGSTASSSAVGWNASAFYAMQSVMYNAVNPDIAVVQLDTNEALAGTSAATYKTNMTTLLTSLVTTRGTPTILVASPPANPGGSGYATVSQANWEAILSAEYDLADTFDIPLLDLTHLFVSQAGANSAGLMADTIHPNGAGYGLVANALSRVLDLNAA